MRGRHPNWGDAPLRAQAAKGPPRGTSECLRKRPGARSEGRTVTWKGMEAADNRQIPAETGERPSERGMSVTPARGAGVRQEGAYAGCAHRGCRGLSD